ncbi:MAG: hypothetical protein ACK559_12885, partial [bacterium]
MLAVHDRVRERCATGREHPGHGIRLNLLGDFEIVRRREHEESLTGRRDDGLQQRGVRLIELAHQMPDVVHALEVELTGHVAQPHVQVDDRDLRVRTAGGQGVPG